MNQTNGRGAKEQRGRDLCGSYGPQRRFALRKRAGVPRDGTGRTAEQKRKCFISRLGMRIRGSRVSLGW